MGSRSIRDGLLLFIGQLSFVEIGIIPFVIALAILFASLSGRWRSKDHRIYALAIVLAGQLIFSVTYAVEDVAVFFLPITMILCFFSTLPRNGWRWNGLLAIVGLGFGVWNGVTDADRLGPRDTIFTESARWVRSHIPERSVVYDIKSGVGTYYGAQAWSYFEATNEPTRGLRLVDNPIELVHRGAFYTFANDIPSLAALRPFTVRPAFAPMSFPDLWSRSAGHQIIFLAVNGRLSESLAQVLQTILSDAQWKGRVGINHSLVAAFIPGQPAIIRASSKERVREAVQIPGLNRRVTLTSRAACCAPEASEGLVYDGRTLLSVNGPGLNVVIVDPRTGALAGRYSFDDVWPSEWSYPPLLLKVQRGSEEPAP